MDIYAHGELAENREQVLKAIAEFLGQNAEPDRVEVLYSLMEGQMNTSIYDEGYTLSTKEGELRFHQYGETRYYHDGSDEDRKRITLCVIDEAQYHDGRALEAADIGTETPCPQDWLELCSEHYYRHIPGRYREYDTYAKDFLQIPFLWLRFEIL